jgi:hypothetical protein
MTDTDFLSVHSNGNLEVELSPSFMENNPNYVHPPKDLGVMLGFGDIAICYLNGQLLRGVISANVTEGWAYITYRGLNYKVYGTIQLFNTNTSCRSARPIDYKLDMEGV